ncbi:MAG: Mut7-C RNAse domain-containing protein [Candidatus Zixiibacteriota bacterium]
MKFICDDNLGKLAKWLRTLGYDTLFFDPIEDGELVSKALKEDRVVLSRDAQLSRFKLKLGERLLLIASEKPLEQLKQVVKHFGLRIGKESLFSRCLICNQVLQKVEKEKIRDRLYPYVYQTQGDFVHCPVCDRIFWPATHVHKMTKTLSAGGIV